MASHLSNTLSVGSARTAAGARLSLRRVVKRFGDLTILRDLDLSVRPGEFIGVVGKSGSGKSTLLRLIAGLDSATEGDVEIDGAPVRGVGSAVRVMFQEARLLPWKRVIDNVALGQRRSARARALEALDSVGLRDRAGDWPSVLSGGQRQRVALGRALASSPRILLLDEPFGALDALTRLEMQALTESLWAHEGFTALLVTHDVEEAVALSDRVILIDEGAIALDRRIDLARPRDRSSPEFARLRGEILNRVMGRTALRPAEEIQHARSVVFSDRR